MDEINILGASMINQVWILGGDFNMITNPMEKQGGLRRIDQESKSFGELIENISLVDVPSRNGIFTWNNKRGKEHRITVHLDRFLAFRKILHRKTRVISRGPSFSRFGSLAYSLGMGPCLESRTHSFQM
jgi:hypothetical protein